MDNKRILLMHISKVSGHYSASLAIERALREVDGAVHIKSIDAFNYTDPYWEKFISLLYLLVIKAVPQFWDYLYDNKKVLKRLRKIRSLIHKAKDKKINRLFDEFKPHVVVCTQAFPCGMVADYKRRHNENIPLIGVLTDYAPHGYWLNDLTDIYVVPASKIKQRFIQRGISEERLKVFGIPVDIKFKRQNSRIEIMQKLGLDSRLPAILIMGGGQGLGPIKQIVLTLDRLKSPAQLIVVCGTNKRLYQWLKKNRFLFNKPVTIIGFTDNVDLLMDISSFIVSKPGGLTSAEALSKSLPIIIVNPLPGQESLNTQFLLEAGVALKVNSLIELKSVSEELLQNSSKLNMLREKSKSFGRADSALKIAQTILNTISQPENR